LKPWELACISVNFIALTLSYPSSIAHRNECCFIAPSVIFVVATVAGCISVITNMSFSSPSIGTGSRAARRAFEFGMTYVVKPNGKHQATIVWLHGLGDNGSTQFNFPLTFSIWLCLHQ
ncbi:hypothetical protein M8C21_028417, partial [Ambrosia artemisiifolia]